MWNSVEDMLVEHEGVRLKPYKDSEGFWTIGVGHLMEDGYENIIWTYEQAMDVLKNDIKDHLVSLRKRVPYYDDLCEARQWALLDMCFNLGIWKLMRFKKMFAALEVDDFEEVEKEALDSKWARQVGGRATQVARMLKTGEFPWTQLQS